MVKIPAAVISGLVTVLFGIIHEAYLYLKKQTSKEMLLKNSLFIFVETTASVGCAAIGKHLWKKHPVIGAIAGSILGSSSAGYIRRAAFA